MKSEKGQAALEFALVLPILLLLVCGVIDFGRIFYTYNNLRMVSQEAAREASVFSTKTDEEIADFAKGKASVEDSSSLTVEVTSSSLPRPSGSEVKVEITYEISYITPFMNTILHAPYTIDTETIARVE